MPVSLPARRSPGTARRVLVTGGSPRPRAAPSPPFPPARRSPGTARRVLVTGGASGLGAALAARYAARGDRVLVTDLATDADVPAGARYQQLDITSAADWAAARERVETEFGGLDVLVN